MENKNNDKEKFYIADTFDNDVTMVMVDKENQTKSCVYIGGKKTLKQTNHRFISRSRKKAVQFLIDKWEETVFSLERQLLHYREKLANARSLLNNE